MVGHHLILPEVGDIVIWSIRYSDLSDRIGLVIEELDNLYVRILWTGGDITDGQMDIRRHRATSVTVVDDNERSDDLTRLRSMRSL